MLARTSLIIAVVCVLTGAAALAQLAGLFQADVPVLTVEEVAAAADGDAVASDGKPVLLVDVRSDEETGVSMIPGAVTRAEYERDPERYAGYRIVSYCTVGYRSRQYTDALLEQGVDAANFDDSIIGWVEAGLPLVTPGGEPTVRVHTWSSKFEVPDTYEQVY